jgi:hypothetical protein
VSLVSRGITVLGKQCPSATLSTTNPNTDSRPTRGHAAPISAAQNVLRIRDWQRLASSLRRDRSVLPTDESHANFCSTRLCQSFMRCAHKREVISPNLSHAYNKNSRIFSKFGHSFRKFHVCSYVFTVLHDTFSQYRQCVNTEWMYITVARRMTTWTCRNNTQNSEWRDLCLQIQSEGKIGTASPGGTSVDCRWLVWKGTATGSLHRPGERIVHGDGQCT